MSGRARTIVERLLSEADVTVDGAAPWDMAVRDDRLFQRVLRGGSLGLGESYVDGWWDCERLDEFFHRVLRARLDRRVFGIRDVFAALPAWLVNLQSPRRAHQIGKTHYDIGNRLYRCMLDARMIYSCGYWRNASTLDEAQEAKLDLVCRKLGLAPGMRVADIGCGWGGTARFAAERYGAEVTGITVSQEQAVLAAESCAGFPVRIALQDYRDLDGKFDRVLSIGMFEHVGSRNYRTFMRVVRRCLADDGVFLLHTIAANVSTRSGDPWIERYIFPNSMLPSMRQIAQSAEGLFVLEDVHGFGADYDKTLRCWFANFDEHWPALRQEYDDRFYRLWKYYLLCCAGAFRARAIQLYQIVFSPKGIPGGWVCRR